MAALRRHQHLASAAVQHPPLLSSQPAPTIHLMHPLCSIPAPPSTQLREYLLSQTPTLATYRASASSIQAIYTPSDGQTPEKPTWTAATNTRPLSTYLPSWLRCCNGKTPQLPGTATGRQQLQCTAAQPSLSDVVKSTTAANIPYSVIMPPKTTRPTLGAARREMHSQSDGLAGEATRKPLSQQLRRLPASLCTAASSSTQMAGRCASRRRTGVGRAGVPPLAPSVAAVTAVGRGEKAGMAS